MTVVLDSNIIISAFSSRGLCNTIVELCLDRYDIVLSDQILGEVRRVFLKKYMMPGPDVEEILGYLREFCRICKYTPLRKKVCRDRDDDRVLALAASNRARFIVTGDKDLLVIKKHAGVAILSLRDFWGVAKQRPDSVDNAT